MFRLTVMTATIGVILIHKITFQASKSSSHLSNRRQAAEGTPSLTLHRSCLYTSLSHRKLEPGGVIILLTRPQQHRREVGLIDCIRPILGLEAETGVLGIDCSTLALQCAIQEVACVKLDPGLGGVHFQYPAASSMMDPCTKMLFLGPLQTEIVVKATDVKLLQAFPKLHWLPHVKCSSLYWYNFSCRNQGFIHRQKSISFYSDFMVINIW